MQDGNHFHILILAPTGLLGIEKFLDGCLLPLRPRLSGFNGQTILRSTGAPCLEFTMDPSTTSELHASGEIWLPSFMAFQLLESLSQSLTRAEFPHWISIDCEQDGKCLTVRYRYPWPDDAAAGT
jgi:hypothetical protein